MEEYYFLFGLALVVTIFAVVQDFKRTEVSNWLNFTFIAVALGYRSFYSVLEKDIEFFVFGLLGFAVFFVIAHGFYYARAFGGGDAKLLMGFGVILPYASYFDLLVLGLGFVFLLLLAGAVYSLVYSVFIVNRDWKKFAKEFGNYFSKYKFIFIVDVVLGIIGMIFIDILQGLLILLVLLLITGLFVYIKALDKVMIRKVKPADLQEGDWLEESVTVRGKRIEKSVHGLSIEEIEKLRKARKEVLIKQGIPFTPAFLIALIVMGYVFLTLGVDLFALFS
tara:strand:- start:1493 stop:2329 length:837 start_codon:yes stop_codon:yes gene_type:complete